MPLIAQSIASVQEYKLKEKGLVGMVNVGFPVCLEGTLSYNSTSGW